MVYVLDKYGQPLMPTERHGKVRHLLKDKQAKVIKQNPFTIQLLYDSTTYTQPITLGVDAGSKHIGISASTSQKELIAEDIQLRTDIVDKISTRREARRARRHRKTRYRKPRFNNRKWNKGWLAPSIRHKIDCHLRAVADVCEILPVTTIIVETASFDIQKLKNPNIKGKEYTQGEQFGFGNIREYILFRDNHECQHCHGKSKDPILNVHHLESRKIGGNSPSNLIVLCQTCHQKYHSLPLEKQEKFNLPKKTASYRDATFMGIMRNTFLNELEERYPDKEIKNTFGYLTKGKRIQLGLSKEHYNDAYCIADNLNAKPINQVIYKKKVRRHNRQIHKFNTIKGGKRKLNQTPYLVHGFRLYDKVLFEGQKCFISGRRERGFFALKTFDWKMVKQSASYKKLKLIESRKGYISEQKIRVFYS